jgi:hypothetical protein
VVNATDTSSDIGAIWIDELRVLHELSRAAIINVCRQSTVPDVKSLGARRMRQLSIRSARLAQGAATERGVGTRTAAVAPQFPAGFRQNAVMVAGGAVGNSAVGFVRAELNTLRTE